MRRIIDVSGSVVCSFFLLSLLLLGDERTNQQDDRGGRMEATVYTKAYHGTAEGMFVLPPTVRWRVLPFYRGVGESGEQVRDDRLTIILEDPPRRFWPLIVKMDLAAAEQFHEQLGKVIEEHRRKNPKGS